MYLHQTNYGRRRNRQEFARFILLMECQQMKIHILQRIWATIQKVENLTNSSCIYVTNFIYIFFLSCQEKFNLILILCTQVCSLRDEKAKLKKRIECLQTKEDLCKCKLPIFEQLIKSDSDVNFYTGIPTISTFKHLLRHMLVEQVIRRLKCFRILSQESLLNLIGYIDDILVTCSAVVNMKEPIMK